MNKIKYALAYKGTKNERRMYISDLEKLNPEDEILKHLSCPVGKCDARMNFRLSHTDDRSSYLCTNPLDKHLSGCKFELNYINASDQNGNNESILLNDLDIKSIVKYATDKYTGKHRKKNTNYKKDNDDNSSKRKDDDSSNEKDKNNFPKNPTNNPTNDDGDNSEGRKRMRYFTPDKLNDNLVGTFCLFGQLQNIELINKNQTLKITIEYNGYEEYVFSSPNYFNTEVDLLESTKHFIKLFKDKIFSKNKKLNVTSIVNVVPYNHKRRLTIYESRDIHFPIYSLQEVIYFLEQLKD
ncbi:hypothetical protein [Apilactobacillus timberlakei]|uniref:Uncharacterized protein n=1 Tax=Apilactobacillus timberlakei TaxID=2008380 RepID=A0ABY2YR15_9LACO|nr:hypothetical protein [Apilactobacillus timberlakei]TPR12212.1 hypothetical protein DY048_07960 [Apilactobacillus timberlakei]TPR12497.1 hypothetical protein DY052_09175 [Apilactobacillus timberlakei]